MRSQSRELACLPPPASPCCPPCSSSPRKPPPRSAPSSRRKASYRPPSRSGACSPASPTTPRRGNAPGPLPGGNRCPRRLVRSPDCVLRRGGAGQPNHDQTSRSPLGEAVHRRLSRFRPRLVVAAQCASPREPVFLPGINSSGRVGGLFPSDPLSVRQGSAWPVAGGLRKCDACRPAVGATAHAPTIAAGWAGLSATRIAHASLNRSPLSFDDIDRNYIRSRRYPACRDQRQFWSAHCSCQEMPAA
jgi:hypothetical protein